MSADLIERLRGAHDPLRRTNLYREAADALAAKDAALSEMRAELERVNLHLSAWEDSAHINKARADEAEAQLERARKALEHIGAVCLDNASPSCRHDLALKFVAGVAARAASRDEGEER